MGVNRTSQAHVVVAPTAYDPSQGFTELALYNPDGTPWTGKTGAAVANLATADGSDPATTMALANATKAKLNALLTSLRAAGLIAP